MKKVLFIVIPLIIILIGVIIILLQPKEEEIKEIKKIESFSFNYTNGYAINSDIRYSLNCKEKCIASIKPYGVDSEDKKEVEVDDNFVKSVIEVLNKYEVIKWDGFDRFAKDVLDGDSFSLSLKANDEISVTASGYMLWPDNYLFVERELSILFEKKYKEE